MNVTKWETKRAWVTPLITSFRSWLWAETHPHYFGRKTFGLICVLPKIQAAISSCWKPFSDKDIFSSTSHRSHSSAGQEGDWTLTTHDRGACLEPSHLYFRINISDWGWKKFNMLKTALFPSRSLNWGDNHTGKRWLAMIWIFLNISLLSFLV